MICLVPAACIGLGLFMLWQAATAPGSGLLVSVSHAFPVALKSLTAQKQLTAPTTAKAAGSAVASCVLVHFLTQVPALSVVCAMSAAVIPCRMERVRHRDLRRRRQLAWCAAAEHLSAAVRAGFTVPEAVRQLVDEGPEELRADFTVLADLDARAQDDAVHEWMRARSTDPVAHRFVAGLCLSSAVGGRDLVRLLRALSSVVHEEETTCSTVAVRTDRAVKAMNRVLAVPWVVLALVGLHGGGAAGSRTGVGPVALATGSGALLLSHLFAWWIRRPFDESQEA